MGNKAHVNDLDVSEAVERRGFDKFMKSKDMLSKILGRTLRDDEAEEMLELVDMVRNGISFVQHDTPDKDKRADEVLNSLKLFKKHGAVIKPIIEMGDFSLKNRMQKLMQKLVTQIEDKIDEEDNGIRFKDSVEALCKMYDRVNGLNSGGMNISLNFGKGENLDREDKIRAIKSVLMETGVLNDPNIIEGEIVEIAIPEEVQDKLRAEAQNGD